MFVYSTKKKKQKSTAMSTELVSFCVCFIFCRVLLAIAANLAQPVILESLDCRYVLIKQFIDIEVIFFLWFRIETLINSSIV